MTVLRQALLPILLLSAGCGGIGDPYRREGTWRPSGANEHNLRAMLVEPRDIVEGRGEHGAEGQRAAEAVERLRTDRVRALPASGIAEIQPTGAPGQGGAGPDR